MGPKQTEGTEEDNPKEGWFTSQYHFKAAWEARNISLYTDKQVHWKGPSEESHPIAVYTVPFKDLAIQISLA